MVIREALDLRIGKNVILPSGKAARLVEISLDEILFEYIEGRGRVLLSRAFCLKMWPKL